MTCLFSLAPSLFSRLHNPNTVQLTQHITVFTWECPCCDHKNTELEEKCEVTCRLCDSAFEVVNCDGDDYEEDDGDWSSTY